ncbi:hypothetical protein PY650_26500 [Rhizobium calliandrae]|uniref:Uncharacterized protein n=1 Tax=Rhizobium calliandrae TaxID=1312182 RepID=A0ABT7KKG0_9HYPH|nr:hypothetical protein [Rhizobium calliandrae]MDL2409123.1 hypothetical protein [Rhizobium calliandrae]
MVAFKSIDEMTIEERQEILSAVVDTLEETSKEASLEGQGTYAENSRNLALAISGSVDDLATDEIEAANILLQQAMTLISQFRLRHPYPATSLAIH